MKPQIIDVDFMSRPDSETSFIITVPYEDFENKNCSPKVYFFYRGVSGKLRFDYSVPLADGIPKVKQILTLS